MGSNIRPRLRKTIPRAIVEEAEGMVDVAQLVERRSVEAEVAGS